MNRRDLLKLGASAAAIPAAAQQYHPPVPNLEKAPSVKPNPEWKPALFDDHQNQTVIALVDLIIPATDTPGAKAALVNRHMDHILAASPVADQQEFLEGLWWLDGYAIRLYGKPFVLCTPARQIEILQTLDTGTAPGIARGSRFFRQLKRNASTIYYSTDIGFKELNKGGRIPGTFGCQHPEHA
jgi:glucoside 3-dehydrogenase (cytochrome c) hitch-hiker subunit